jgi:hypothetical protein
VREIMKFLKRKYLDRAGVLRDVEKVLVSLHRVTETCAFAHF